MKINKSQYLALVLVMVFILMSAVSYAKGSGDIGFLQDETNDQAVAPPIIPN